MPDLNFQIVDAAPVARSATPVLSFRLRIDDRNRNEGTTIQSVLLRVQIRIEPTRRTYSQASPVGLVDLFGERQGWGASMRSMLWTNLTLVVPPFEGETIIDVPVECTFDFNVAATKYIDAIHDGDVPLCFLFSGTVFADSGRGIEVSQISWEREASYRLPIHLWKELMERYYAGSAWIQLDRDVFDRLYEFKSRNAIPTWGQAIEKLLMEDGSMVKE